MSTNNLTATNDYSLFCEGRLADPYPLLAELRDREPVHWSDRLNAWLVTRYEDVQAGLLDRRLANDSVSLNIAALPPEMRTRYAALGEHVSNWLGYTDPPKHTRLHGLLKSSLTPALALLEFFAAFGYAALERVPDPCSGWHAQRYSDGRGCDGPRGRPAWCAIGSNVTSEADAVPHSWSFR